MSATPEPIRIGYCLSLTGPVADNSRSARLAHDIWREDVNGRGGLLVKTTLGPLLNGFVNYEYWVPVPKRMFPSVQEMLNTYQARANDSGVDLLGHYMAPLAYAQMQVVAQAVKATGGFDDASLSAYARGATFHTVMGDIRFGVNGEWSEPRVLQVQFQGISGHDVGQFRNGSRQIVVSPPNFVSGGFRFPYAEAFSAGQTG